MSHGTFTVVVPAHNAEETVDSAIRSVLQQTRDDFELIVVDDGSSDGTAAHVAQFGADPRVKLISQRRQGPAAARNAGIRAGSGALVAMLDADDLWLPGYLDAMARALAADDGAGFAYTDAWVLDAATGRIRRTTAMSAQRPPAVPPSDPEDLMLMLVERNFVYTAATVRREVLEEVGGYDERFHHGEDCELWLRIAERGYRAARAEGILAVHREDSSSLTSNADDALERAGFLYATLAREHADTGVRKIAAAHEGALARQRRRLTQPTVADRMMSVARRMYSAQRERSLWFDEPPREVAEALARVGD